MKTEDAIEVCEGWFAYIERQRRKSIEIQKLAAMARNGQQEEAQQRLRQLDTTSVTVYDGSRLEPAVRHLVKLASQVASLRKQLAGAEAAIRELTKPDEPALTAEGTARALQPELERAGWDLSLGSIAAVLEALDFHRRASLTGVEFLQAWMRTPNPMLGDVAPLTMLKSGRGDRLAMFIEHAYEAEQPPEKT